MQIPKHIRLELKDSDVEKDIIRILHNMEQLRAEAVFKRAINAKVEREYKNLARELAYEIDTLRHYDSLLKERFNVIVSELNKERLLLKYDPFQDLFWKKKTPDFIKNLDMVLLRFLNVDIDTADKKHHIMQAVKRLLDGDAMLDSGIFYGAVDISQLEKEIGFTSMLSEIKPEIIFGNFAADPNRMLVEKTSNSTLTLNCVKENMIEPAFKEAKKLGYIYLRLVIEKDRYLRNKDTYPGCPIHTKENIKLFKVKGGTMLCSDKIVLENRLQTIDILPKSSTALCLHELLKEAYKKGLHEKCPDLINNLTEEKGIGYSIIMEFSQQNREFVAELRKRSLDGRCITSTESISGYKRTERIFADKNETSFLISVSENENGNSDKINKIFADYGNAHDKIKKILSAGVCCARLLKFDADRLAESYEGVR